MSENEQYRQRIPESRSARPSKLPRGPITIFKSALDTLKRFWQPKVSPHQTIEHILENRDAELAELQELQDREPSWPPFEEFAAAVKRRKERIDVKYHPEEASKVIRLFPDQEE